MEDIIRDYFVRPIFERTGYNAVNTLAYAAIAIVSLYFIWRYLKGKRFDFASVGFLRAVGAFVLFGSTARVVTDLSDAGGLSAAAAAGGQLGAIYTAVNASGIFAYGYLTVTPGIYIATAILFLVSIAVGKAMKNENFAMYAGLSLFLPCLLLLLPFMAHAAYFALVIAIAAACSLASFFLLGKSGVKLDAQKKLAILGQTLDGAATFVVIDVFAKQSGKDYFEQHVLSSGIGTATPLGFGLFLAVKVALASLIVYFVSKEEIAGGDKALILIAVAIMGFAPGIRDALRMLCGT